MTSNLIKPQFYQLFTPKHLFCTSVFTVRVSSRPTLVATILCYDSVSLMVVLIRVIFLFSFRGVNHPTYPSVLQSLEIEDPVVANCLIDQRGIEKVLLIKVTFCNLTRPTAVNHHHHLRRQDNRTGVRRVVLCRIAPRRAT